MPADAPAPADAHAARWLRRDHARGAVVFDPDVVAEATPALFDASAWPHADGGAAGGRGSVAFVRGDALRGGIEEAALRHYRRGGMMARVSHDGYLFRGAERTRSFREFRMLQRLRAEGLPVPRPLAAGYVRDGLLYRADILSERIAPARTLAQRLPQAFADAALWQRLGATLARFHARGAYHADLNAHNILIDEDDGIWVIDFDRSRWRRPEQGWAQANLARLARSLRKLGAERSSDWPAAWRALQRGYDGEVA